jgi:DNA mismatch repair protein MSH6
LKETTKANTLPKTTPLSKPKATPTASAKQTTPVPDSDVIEPPSSQENLDATVKVSDRLSITLRSNS